MRDLVTLATEVDRAADTAVAGLRQHGYSWADIASRLGITAKPRNDDGVTQGSRERPAGTTLLQGL